MRVISFILFIILGIFSCQESSPPFYKTQNFWGYFLLLYNAENTKKAKIQSCNQPNAVNGRGDSSIEYYCTTNKVTEGAIYDASTGAKVITDTVSAGASLKCQCPISGRETSTIIWARTDNSNVGKDNPTLTRINVYNASTNPKEILFYPSGYNQTDNIYCIAVCKEADGTITDELYLFYYQILKIR